MIKEDFHLRWGQRASCRVLKHGAHLFERDARKPLNELINRSTVFKVLEQRRYGHARAAEHPGSAVSLGVLFDGLA